MTYNVTVNNFFNRYTIHATKSASKPLVYSSSRQVVQGSMAKVDPVRLNEVDLEVLNEAATGKGTTLTPELWKELKIGAAQVSDAAEAWCKENLTGTRAELIKLWRADEGYTWRSIAAAAHKEFHGDWKPESNQLWGMELCKVAANLLNEDPDKEPWN